ncbi:MAG: amidase [Woeseiaceae bacterium]
MTSLAFESITSIAMMIRDGRTSAVDITQLMLNRIEKFDGRLNAFITVMAESALCEARQADEELSSGTDRGLLHGIPIAVKDLIATQGVRTTGGSKLYEQWVPDEDAAVVRKLREAGAVIIGKTGLHELAYGTTSKNEWFGDVRNPRALDHIAGGSSGGSAAAVTAGLAYAAIGTDTGCSIRQPAHCCGIVGHKPTYGLVSKHGVIPLVYSMDHVGPLARSVKDTAIVLDAIAGFDPQDPRSIKSQQTVFSSDTNTALQTLRIGVVRRFFFDGDRQVVSVVDDTLEHLSSLGAQIIELDIPEIEQVSEASRILFLEALTIYEDALNDTPDVFGAEVRGKLEASRNISATSYAAAREYQLSFRQRIDQLMTDCDFLCAPTSTASAVPLDNIQDGFARHAWKNTCVFDFTGQPSISIPCGATPTGLPVGMMLTGKFDQDAKLLEQAREIETVLSEFEPPTLFRS